MAKQIALVTGASRVLAGQLPKDWLMMTFLL